MRPELRPELPKLPSSNLNTSSNKFLDWALRRSHAAGRTPACDWEAAARAVRHPRCRRAVVYIGLDATGARIHEAIIVPLSSLSVHTERTLLRAVAAPWTTASI